MAKDKTIDTECTHYWILTPPRGELTSGTCKKCGAEKQFTGERMQPKAGRPPNSKRQQSH